MSVTPQAPARPRSAVFAYSGLELDPPARQIRCHYKLDDVGFVETFAFPSATSAGGEWSSAPLAAAAKWLYLLAGVSYYKAGAPLAVDASAVGLSLPEARFLKRFYLNGLAEFAFRNGLDLSDLTFDGGSQRADSSLGAVGSAAAVPDANRPEPTRPLVPFGGGIDSIVTAELVRRRAGDGATALFIMSRTGDSYAAVEAAAAVTGLLVVRAERSLDAAILGSTERGFFNGHVPVTGVVSAAAVVAAALQGHDAVVMSNEASASVGNLVSDGHVVNHQWSKSVDFEEGFRSVLAEGGVGVDYFSLLRPASELWVARQFAGLSRYHGTFRSCNKAFFVDPARRLDHWCGECDKCCFVDLILAPYMPAAALSTVFGGNEPLANSSLAGKFRVLLALSDAPKPFDCVGDTAECREALRLAVARADRAGTPMLQELATELPPAEPGEAPSELGGPHFIPDAYTPGNLLV